MKTRKLTLNKETVTRLDQGEMSELNGGKLWLSSLGMALFSAIGTGICAYQAYKQDTTRMGDCDFVTWGGDGGICPGEGR